MSDPITYADGEIVELGDNVTFEIDHCEHSGQVQAIHPRRMMAKVMYRDHTRTNKDGSGKLTRINVPLCTLDLLRREG